MSVIVDTSVWSLSLRRHTPPDTRSILLLEELIREYRVQMLGIVRQEILSSFKDPRQFERLKARLRLFPDLPIETKDHELAAEFSNTCRRNGVTPTTVDILLCAVAHRRSYMILTEDADFQRYSQHIPIDLLPV